MGDIAWHSAAHDLNTSGGFPERQGLFICAKPSLMVAIEELLSGPPLRDSETSSAGPLSEVASTGPKIRVEEPTYRALPLPHPATAVSVTVHPVADPVALPPAHIKR